MSPELLQIGILALQALVREAPGAIVKIRETLGKAEITSDDWDKLRAEIQGDTYEKLVPASKLPPEDPTVNQSPS